MARVRFSG
uniref:Uncharacterized protein n=1 Tax=Arundo donax TaxID=35708 RepID=A0A0A9GQW7_ARUDO